MMRLTVFARSDTALDYSPLSNCRCTANNAGRKLIVITIILKVWYSTARYIYIYSGRQEYKLRVRGIKFIVLKP